MRPVVCALLFSSLAPFASAAHAGSYVGVNQETVSGSNPAIIFQTPYSGGIYSVPGPSGTQITPSDAFGMQGYGGSSGGTTAACTGPITASWTWVADPKKASDPPPTQVIVTETCTANVTVVSPAAGGKYDTGIGESGSVSWTPGGNNMAGATVVRYSTHAGGVTVTLSAVSASASAAAPGDTANVYYTASLSPVFVNPAGAYNPANGDYHVLTGQQITATLTGIPGGFTVTGYTWAISPSATVFKTYNEKALSNQLVPLSPTELSGPATGSTTVTALNFYDRVKEDLTITCTVAIIAPDGTALNVTATSPTINVLKPTASWAVDPKTVTIGGQTVNNIIGFKDDSADAQFFGVNTTWYPAKITVPTPFVGIGQGCFAQLVTPSATLTRKNNGTGASSYSFKIQNAQGVWVAPGTGLDKGFPFPIGLATDANGNLTGGQAADSSWQVNGTGASGDYPKGQETTTDVDGGGTTWTSSSISDSFTTWLMYKPDGGVWIPLKSATWTAAAQASGGPSNWSATGGPTPVGGYTAPVPADATAPPQWSTVISNQQYRP